MSANAKRERDGHPHERARVPSEEYAWFSDYVRKGSMMLDTGHFGLSSETDAPAFPSELSVESGEEELLYEDMWADALEAMRAALTSAHSTARTEPPSR